MKKISVSLLLLLMVELTTALANDETGISKQVKKNFEKEFAGAKSVKWNNLGDYQVATFAYDNTRVEAYFNTATGELEGSARYLIFDQLPMAVVQTFNKNFARKDFISALEISNADGVFYMLTAETQNRKYSFKVSDNGNVVSKIRIKQ